MPSDVWGKLLVWHSSHRASYVIEDVGPARTITLASFLPWQDSSFLLYYRYRAAYDTEAKDRTDLTDNLDFDRGDAGLPSPIPRTASPWSPYDDTSM